MISSSLFPELKKNFYCLGTFCGRRNTLIAVDPELLRLVLSEPLMLWLRYLSHTKCEFIQRIFAKCCKMFNDNSSKVFGTSLIVWRRAMASMSCINFHAEYHLPEVVSRILSNFDFCFSLCFYRKSRVDWWSVYFSTSSMLTSLLRARSTILWQKGLLCFS